MIMERLARFEKEVALLSAKFAEVRSPNSHGLNVRSVRTAHRYELMADPSIKRSMFIADAMPARLTAR